MMTDPIADLLTCIRNASRVRKRIVTVPSSKMKVAIVKVLHNTGFILNYKEQIVDNKAILKIALKYDGTKTSVITTIQRVSRPGLRVYASVAEIPRVANGMGISIVSTSKGVMAGAEAKELKIGGEVLCIVL